MMDEKYCKALVHPDILYIRTLELANQYRYIVMLLSKFQYTVVHLVFGRVDQIKYNT